MESPLSQSPVLHAQTQAPVGNRECQFIPGDFGIIEPAHFEAFGTRFKLVRFHLCQIFDMNSADTGQVDGDEGLYHFHLRPRLFPCFTDGAVDGGFTDFQEAGGGCPFAMGRFDGASAEKDAISRFDHGTDHDPGIDVMNVAAGSADSPGTVFTIRDLVGQGFPTLVAEFGIRVDQGASISMT